MKRTKEDIIKNLESLQPEQCSGWRERAEWRRQNRAWIRRSQEIAIQMLTQMERLHLTQTALAERMGCTQQFVSKILKGQENLTLETITCIEDALELTLLVRPAHRYVIPDESYPNIVAEP